MDEKTVERIAKKAAKEALADTRKLGLRVGQLVVPWKDDARRTIYRLKKIEGKMATVSIPAKYSPTGKLIEKQFPVDQLFDAALSFGLAMIAGAAENNRDAAKRQDKTTKRAKSSRK